MKKVLFLLLLLSPLFAEQTVTVAGLKFRTDEEKPFLQKGEEEVFPFTDEALLLIVLASKEKNKRAAPFDLVVDPFCGDGKSGLPLIYYGIAKQLIGSDINPRAIEYAGRNVTLNHLDNCYFYVRDIVSEGVIPSLFSGNTLWIANPPFSLKAKGTAMEIMRDGGENGLKLTLAFVEKALHASVPGDLILGIGYSRIHQTGYLELEEELKKLTAKHGATYRLELLEGEKLWRGINGKKEQDNPMRITGEIFALKADPSDQQAIATFHAAAKFHNQEGFERLGYYVYFIQK